MELFSGSSDSIAELVQLSCSQARGNNGSIVDHVGVLKRSKWEVGAVSSLGCTDSREWEGDGLGVGVDHGQ